jgi:hypothetical protein
MRPAVEDERDLEPGDDDPDGAGARYIRESSEPEIDDERREIWLYLLSPRSYYDDPTGSARHRLDVRSCRSGCRAMSVARPQITQFGAAPCGHRANQVSGHKTVLHAYLAWVGHVA